MNAEDRKVIERLSDALRENNEATSQLVIDVAVMKSSIKGNGVKGIDQRVWDNEMALHDHVIDHVKADDIEGIRKLFVDHVKENQEYREKREAREIAARDRRIIRRRWCVGVAVPALVAIAGLVLAYWPKGAG